MSYAIETKLASKNGWHTPDEAKSWYGKYARDGVTIHWWNSPDKAKDSDHNNIVNYLNGNAAKGAAPTVNYVLSNSKITMCVHPDNVAWASNNGNATTVSIECSPHLNAEGYKKAGWLTWQLEKRYNKKLAIYPHKYWTSTACPGTTSLDRIRNEANKWGRGDYNPKPKPKPTPTPVLVWSKLPKPVTYVANKPVTSLWDFNKTTWDMGAVKKFKKGEKIVVYGKVVNKTLGATYLLTEYSYTKRITNGFNQADMDIYTLPPAPTPLPPAPPKEEQPQEPPKTEPPVPPAASDFEARLSALEKAVQAIVTFLSSIFKDFKKG